MSNPITHCNRITLTDPDVDDYRCDHDANALQQISHHMNEGGAHAGVVVAAEHVGVAVGDGTEAALVHLVVAIAPGAEGGGAMQDVGHAEEGTKVLPLLGEARC